MMSSEQIAHADAIRRDYLNRICAKQRNPGRGHNPHPNKGLELAKLPANWQAIKDAVFANIHPDHLREHLGCVTVCVGAKLGISHTAIGRDRKVSAQTVLAHVRRQNRQSFPWLRAEVERVAEMCPAPVYEEGKEQP